jgi:hypothetical protein
MGVFLPLLLLMTPPIPIGPVSDQLLFVQQGLILAGVIVFVLLLLGSILTNLGDERPPLDDER